MKTIIQQACSMCEAYQDEGVADQCPRCRISEELFDMVYQWGRVGIITDYTCNAFQDKIKELLQTVIKKNMITPYCNCDDPFFEGNDEGWICLECNKEANPDIYLELEAEREGR